MQITSVEDAAYHAAHNYPGGVESLAPRMRVGAQVLRNKLNPSTRTHHLTLAEADSLIGLTGDKSILHALAINHGMVCVPMLNDGEFACDVTVLETVTRLWRLGGHVGQAVDETLADNKVEKIEVQQVREHVYRNIAALHELVALLDGMAE
ncbi:phage regulatory CII family protein [Deefgea piscis]|uniref:phage regulatory CII family protein n=1 Tax=Deefgea piscis TaxID=2739061 RepID=UPI001C7E6CC5|nr:phage regulatory CII family protein [Deefgea piscis]QZA80256.1 phage regulatory CII family protein [Deefgea piscis]